MKRKLLALMTLPIMILALSLVLAQRTMAADTIEVYVDPPKVLDKSLIPNSSFYVAVKIDNIPASPGLAAMQFSLSWNRTLLEAANMTEVIFHEMTPENETENILMNSHVIDNTAGELQYNYTWTNITRAIEGGYCPITGNHTVATIAFKVKSTGSCPLNLTAVEILDPNGSSVLGLNRADGFFDNILGDVNGDGMVDILDAIAMANAYGSDPTSQNWNPNADMNGDNKIDVLDAILISNNFGRRK